MKRTISIFMLGIALVLASCSQDEDLTQPAQNSVVTFNVGIDGSMNLRSAKTRSVTDPTDEAITRAVLEIRDASDQLVGSRIEGIISGDAITFTASLEEGESYTCLFWADGGSNAYDIDDLEAIKRGTAPSIAYYAKEEITASSTAVNVTLTHAVSKVVLDETGTLAVGDKVGLSFSLPGYTFNVTDGSCTEGISETITGSFEITSTATTGQVGWLYVFAPAEGADPVTVTLSYTAAGGGGDKTLDISNVPLKRNYRTVLKGAFASIGTLTQGFNATLDKNWDSDNNVYLQKLTSTAAGEITANPTLIGEFLNADGTLVIEGPVNADDIYTVGQWAVANTDMLKSLDLSGTTGLTEIKYQTFDECVSLTSVILPSSLQTIGVEAFRGAGLVKIQIPYGVTSLGNSCFYRCLALEYITLPENLTAIQVSTFNGCSALKEITIPASVATIGYAAFTACSALESIVFEGNMPVASSTDNDPTGESGKLILNNYIMGYSSPLTGFNVFLPNITDQATAETYKTFFTTASDVYYNYTGGANGDKTDMANYTKYE